MQEQKETDTTFLNDFSQEIWEKTFKYHEDSTIDDTLIRVAKGVASAEKTPQLRTKWENLFYEMLKGFKVTAAGRIYSNAGTEYTGTTLANCFLGPRATYDIDSIEGILQHLEWQSKTLKSEGGWGENFSYIRPRGSFIHGVGIESPGAVKFMELFDKSSDIITAGSGKELKNKKGKNKIRKGAQMAVLDCLSGDSRIDTLEGRIPIKELVGKNPYLYCTDGKGNVFVRQALKVWSKGVRKTVKIVMDNNEFIECTPEHKFLLSDGSYVKAKDLKFGDSLAALNRTLNGNYIYLGVAGTRKSIAEHNAVFEMKYGQFPSSLSKESRHGEMTVAHHSDHNSINNFPENIESMTISEHSRHHVEHLLEHQKRISKERRGKTWEEYYGKERADEIRAKRKKTDNKTRRAPWNDGLVGDDYKDHYKSGFSNQFAENRNHKVVSIENSIEQEVFDISMPAPYHNFSVNEVFVHNCTHPDVIEFITAKLSPGRLSKFNLSVNCTDEFMQRIIQLKSIGEEGKDTPMYSQLDSWNLVFPDTQHEKYKEEWDGVLKNWRAKGYPVVVHNTVSAMWLWNLIMESTYTRNDPGVLFLDRANYYNPLNYGEIIVGTNPCFDGDTLIGVADGRGAVPISQLEQEGRDVPVYSVDRNTGKVSIKMARNPRITGYDKELLRVTLDDDSYLDVTPNHRFFTMDGREVEAKELKLGDSLPRFTKRKHSMNKGTDSKNYWQIVKNVNDYKDRALEHRLIAEFYQPETWKNVYNETKKNGWVSGGLVIHHKDYDGLNNFPENLEIMTWKDHQKFHSEHDCKGEKNGMFGKNHSDETREKIGEKTKERWESEEFREFQRCRQASGITEESRRLISEARKRRYLEYLKQCEKETDLDTFWENETLYVKKVCEGSGQEFIVPWNRREICFAPGVNAMESVEIKEKARANMRKVKEENAKKTRHLQIMAYKDLQEELGRDPWKVEWITKCKKQDVSHRLGQKTENPYIIKTYKELKKVSEEYNHRVKSVEKIEGLHTVYNLTVDDNHTVSIITSQGNVLSGIYTLNCGEQTLAPGGVCDLGSINLTQFVKEQDSQFSFDFELFRKYVPILVRFLDNVNSISNTPLPQYTDSMRHKRRIGCGILGWGSLLYMLRIRFGSKESAILREQIMKTLAKTAYETSIDLAIEKGMFTYCDPEKHAQGVFVQSLGLSDEYMKKLKTTGIRNSSLLSVQPTGNTSIFANIVSGGLEPIFLPEYIRTTIVTNSPPHIEKATPKWYAGEWKETDMFKFSDEGGEEILRGVDEFGTVWKIDKNRGLTKEVLCEDYGVQWLKSRGLWDGDANWAVSTENLSAQEHLDDLIGFATFIDSACSKTINLPNDYSYEDFQEIYLNAYKSGVVKGVTTYRAGTMTSVLSASDEKPNGEEPEEELILDDVKMPDSIPAVMKTIRAEGKKWYVTIVYYDNSNRPFAIFVKTNNHESNVVTNNALELIFDLAEKKGINPIFIEDVKTKINKDSNSGKITRALSLLLRHGVLIKNICVALDKVEGIYVGSFIFQIKKLLQSHIKEGEVVEGEVCEECGSDQVVYSEGCFKCAQCGHSKCG